MIEVCRILKKKGLVDINHDNKGSLVKAMVEYDQFQGSVPELASSSRPPFIPYSYSTFLFTVLDDDIVLNQIGHRGFLLV